MTPKEAADVINCTVGQVRTLIRTGKLKAKKRPAIGNAAGWVYDISEAEANRYASTPQTTGFPRGQRRK